METQFQAATQSGTGPGPSTKKAARVAGLVYVPASIPGVFCPAYIPFRFIVRGDATARASKILDSEFVFRPGIVGEVIGFTAFIFVVRALHRLMSGVDKAQASLMATLILVSIPISLINVFNEIAALILVRGADSLSIFTKP